MKNTRKAIILLAAIMSAAVSCQKVEPPSSIPEESSHEEVPETTEAPTKPEFNIRGKTITWLADYDLNPQDDAERSVALSLFEDYYGARINFVHTASTEKFTRLSQMLMSGEEVDMFPYEWNAVPDGVLKDQYQPLDPYFDILGIGDDEEGLWNDMDGVIDMFAFNDQHYVIPYDISNPVVITYSRKLMKEEGLDDPYELYQKGEWNWDTMMQMMEKFVANNESGKRRYGLNGYFGPAVIQSTGESVVKYENGRFSNNINNPSIEKAGLFMQELAEKHLYDPQYIGHFPKDDSTLFFSMGDWALGASNALNPESDLMVVPFPKSPDADKNYLCCNFGARMLVKNSTNGDAVAAYIKCERIAATQEEYKAEKKKQATTVYKTSSGNIRSFVTEEQYDAIQSYLDPANTTPTFDFAYGMGERMNSEGDYTYATRGVMNNLTESLPQGIVSSWSGLCDEWSGVIDEVVQEFNDRMN